MNERQIQREVLRWDEREEVRHKECLVDRIGRRLQVRDVATRARSDRAQRSGA